MKIICTGSSGFIGKVFVKMAISAGHDLTILGREWNNPIHLSTIQWANYDAVVHLAAAGVKREHREWGICTDINFYAVRCLLWSISNSKATPLVIMARSIRESQPEIIDDPYVVSKRKGSHFADEWAKSYRGILIGLEIEPCYGPGQVELVAQRLLDALDMPPDP